MKTRGLTHRQMLFVVEYLRDLNGTQAAIRAGYSEKGADVTAARLLGNVSVRAEVERRQARVVEKFELKAEDVLRGLEREAKFEGTGASHGARVNAWTQLGRHLALFVDKINLGINSRQELAELLNVDVDELPE